MLYVIMFLLIGITSFLFAMLGLGGGTVYVPLINWAGYDMKEVAIPLGLLLNGLNTLFVMIPFARGKLIDWKGGAVMAVVALIASPIGAYFTKDVPVGMLKILFAALVIVAASRIIITSGKSDPESLMPFRKRAVIGGFTGLFAGFIGGLLGIGGGFIIAPILMWMGYKTKEAAATTAFVVTFSSFSGYLGHMAQGSMNWPLTVTVIIAVIIGSQFGGKFLIQKAKSKHVKITYAIVLFLIAVKLIVDVIIHK